MFEVLARNWWMVALRGVAAIFFGIVAIAWPDITVGVLIIFFGAYALVDGAFSIAASFSAQSDDRWWYIVRGVAGIVAGLIAWSWPGLTALALLYIIAVWALFTGGAEIAAAVSLHRQAR